MSGPSASPTPVRIGAHELRLTNLDKVLYPATGTTKAEVVRWYADAAAALLPGAHGRPVTRKRWPDGVDAEPFFEKNLPAGAPDWVARVTLPHTERDITYPVLPDLPDAPEQAVATLVWLAQGGALELHVPQWQVLDGTPATPDRIVIDLDPGPGAGLDECAEVALAVRDRLARDGLRARPVTSGSKGMQLYAALEGTPLAGARDELTAEYVKVVAQELAAAAPALVEWRMATVHRPGKVFIDWSQNNARKTTIAPWSLRGLSRPYVAVPRDWSEVEAGGLVQLTMDEARERLSDPVPVITR
jgi:bifunctional non-homologous end joining protein LigD